MHLNCNAPLAKRTAITQSPSCIWCRPPTAWGSTIKGARRLLQQAVTVTLKHPPRHNAKAPLCIDAMYGRCVKKAMLCCARLVVLYFCMCVRKWGQ